MEWILQIPVLFFAVIFHEFAHGFVAFRKGDDTAYLSGRLTLNPVPHVDLMGTIVLPALCIFSHMPVIGWAKPVPINPYRMPRPRRDMALVALSGPVSNLFLSLVAFAAYKLFSMGFMGVDLTLTMLKAMSYGIMINLALAFFNLIPVYPLDGSQILLGLLPENALKIYEKHIPYGMYIILILAFTGLIKYIIFPPMLIAINLLTWLGGFSLGF